MKLSKRLFAFLIIVIVAFSAVCFTSNLRASAATTSSSTVAKPNATSKITVSHTQNSITLKWATVKGVTSYRIYQKVNDNWKSLGYVNGTTYTVKNLKAGTKYKFVVKSYIKTSSGSVAGKYKEIETATKPNATSSLNASQTTNSITLKWNKVNGVTSYRIYQKTSDGWKALGYTDKLTYTIANLKTGSKYTFAVRSYIKTSSGSVVGNYRELQSATKAIATSKITTSQTNNGVTLNWSKVNGVTNYRIYQKVNNGWKSLGYTNKLTYTISNLKGGTKYTFAVRSYMTTTSGSVAGNYKEVQTATKAVATSKITATQTNNSVTLNWSKVNGVTNYRIYQKVNNEWVALGYTDKFTYTINNLKTGTKYAFAVRSYIKTTSGSVAGNYKEIETATKLNAPHNVKTTATENAVTLSWGQVKGASGYRLYYKTSNDSSWITAVNSTTLLKQTIGNLKSGESYLFAIKPYISTTSGVVWGCYDEIAVNTKMSADDLTRQWFINQYDIAEKQYINQLMANIYLKEYEIDVIKSEASQLYGDYIREIQRIKEYYANAPGTMELALHNAQQNYSYYANLYTERRKTIEKEIMVIEEEINNPNVDNILSIISSNCSISSKETYEYYYYYIDYLN